GRRLGCVPGEASRDPERHPPGPGPDGGGGLRRPADRRRAAARAGRGRRPPDRRPEGGRQGRAEGARGGSLRPPLWYVGLVAASGAQRVRELAVSRRNERGVNGRRAAARTYPLMVAAHVGLCTLPLLEVAVRRRRPWAPALWIGVLGAAAALRLWSIG